MGTEIQIDPKGEIYADLKKSGTIKIFRSRWPNFPAEGFKTEAGFQNWVRTDFFRLAQNRHHKLRDDAHRNLSEKDREFRDLYSSFNRFIYGVLYKKKLPDYYFDYIMQCLYLTYPPLNFIVTLPLPEVEIRRNPETRKRELWVQVFGHTTEDEWKLAWHTDVERQLFHLPGFKDQKSKEEMQEYLYAKYYQPGVSKKDKIKVTRQQLSDFADKRWNYKVSPHYLSIIFYRINLRLKQSKNK